jgi:acetolactate synthase-1/2/3 large subunit
MALGSFPHSHPLHMGMPGMHGSVAAVTALQKSDLLITLGARFDDRVTGKLSTFAVNAKVIHCDVDPAEIGKNRFADVPVVGDLKHTLIALIPALKAALAKNRPDLSTWIRQVNNLKSTYPLGYDKPSDGSVSPQYVIERIAKLSAPDSIYVAGVGQHQMWAAQFVPYELPRTWLNSGGLGTMGYSVPAAMGAKVAAPDTTVWSIDGDGCFQMTNQELVTCALNNIPIKVAIINNESLGMVRQWQTLFYEGRYSNTNLESKRVPDFPKLADAMGCVGLSCDRPEDVDKTIEKALSINDQPVVVDFRVHRDAMVWPLEVLVENSPGVLARVSGLFARRAYNIDALKVGPTENPAISKMEIDVNVEGHALEQVISQLDKLINVISIKEILPTNVKPAPTDTQPDYQN